MGSEAEEGDQSSEGEKVEEAREDSGGLEEPVRARLREELLWLRRDAPREGLVSGDATLPSSITMLECLFIKVIHI